MDDEFLLDDESFEDDDESLLDDESFEDDDESVEEEVVLLDEESEDSLRRPDALAPWSFL